MSATDEAMPEAAAEPAAPAHPAPDDPMSEDPMSENPMSEDPMPDDPVSDELSRPAIGGRITPMKPLAHRLEALVFASGQPLSTARLAKLLGTTAEELQPALEALREAWIQRPGAIDLVEIAGGWRFMTRPAFHDDLLALAAKKGTDRLSPAALETLAVVAYRQPITREEIEGIRGVQSGPLLRALLERDLIRIKGRSSKPGHPLLYGTTKRFLDHFGLESLKSLPDLKDLLDA